MQTLTYGLKLPDTGDKGSVFFPALEDNITQLDSHNHNGTNSPKIPASSVQAVTQTLLAASWTDLGGNIYRQLVTMPGAILFDEKTIQVVINSGADVGEIIRPTIKKVSTNTFYIYVNDNSIDLKVIYS